MTIALGLVAALAATLALDLGFLLQHQAAGSMPPIAARRPLAAARSFLHSPRWLTGFTTGLAGWALYVGALTLAPLSLVQTLAASGVAALAVLAVLQFDAVLTSAEWRGVWTVAVGLGLLGLSLTGPASARQAASTAALVMWIGASLVLVLGLLVTAPVRHRLASAAVGALAAGLFYGTGDVTTKALLVALPSHPGIASLLSSPWLYATLALHAAGFCVLQRTFQLGGAVSSVTLLTAATNLVPIAAGVAVLGDPLPADPVLLVLRGLAFVLVLAGAASLSRVSAAYGSAPGV